MSKSKGFCLAASVSSIWGSGSRLAVVLAVVVVAVGGASAMAADVESAVSIAVLENTQDSIVLRYQIGDFILEPVTIDGEDYAIVKLGKESRIKEVGAPDVANVYRSIIIPDDAAMEVQVVAARYYDIADVAIAPSKGYIVRPTDPASVPYTFGEVYEEDAFYPAELVRLHDPYIMRDYRGVLVELNPLQYNPVTHTLRVYTEVTVEVVNTGPGRINVLDRDHAEHELSLSFHNIYGSHFVNYVPPQRYDPLDETGDMLIIAHDAWIANVQPLADHKTSIGINATVVGVSTIPGGNNATAIKNYIQTVYDSSDLAFVLLVGDATQVVPAYASGGASDPSYSKLAGSDSYPEIMVGRFSAENPGQVDTQVERTIEYENMPATGQDWFWRGMGVASNQGPGDDGEYDNEHVDNIRDDLLAYGYTLVDQIYDPGASAAAVTAGLNAGRGIINYTGHGGPTSWSTTGFDNGDVNALANDNMLPFIVTVACNNGQFDSYTCFGEAWLRATNGSEPSGAIGCYASSIGQSWSPPMEAQDEFNLLYVAEEYVTYGALCYAGSCSMMDDYPGSAGISMFDTWILFGDPSLRVVGTVAPPTGMKVAPGGGLIAEGQTGGPFFPDSIVYTVANNNETPLDYLVSKSEPWVSVTNPAGTLPGLGSTTVTVSINALANSLVDGVYTDLVEFVNTTDHDGDTTRDVQLAVGVPVPVYTFPMDSDPGWTTQGEWAFGQPTGQGGTLYGYPDPTSGATGSYVYGYNLNGDYSTSIGGPYYLTTGVMDLTGVVEVSLKFQRWLNTDYEPYVSATIEISTDGTTWAPVWINGGAGTSPRDSSWTAVEYDLSATADNQGTVYLRFSHAVTQNGAYALSGWNIDDLDIWGRVPSVPSCPWDIDGDGMVTPFDSNFVMARFACNVGGGDPDCDRADVDGNGEVNPFDSNAVMANYGPCP